MRHSLSQAVRSCAKVTADGRMVGVDEDDSGAGASHDDGGQYEPEPEPQRSGIDYDGAKKRKRALEKEWKQKNRGSADKSNSEYYERNKFALNRISRLKDYNNGSLRAVPSARAIAKYGLLFNGATKK